MVTKKTGAAPGELRSDNMSKTSYDLVKGRLDTRKKGTPMTIGEAKKIFDGTTISIIKNPAHGYGKYMWFAIMCEQDGFNTPRSAVNSALKYLEHGGY